YRLVLGARREERLSELAEELGGPERAIAVRCDVTEWEECRRIAEAATESFGRLDAVFANAGFGAKRGFLEESPDQWRSMVLTNVLGVALTIRATLPTLLDAGTGHYVITSSVAGRRALPGSLYSATKWAVGAIGESLRQELRQVHENHGIRVTLIEPGMTDTDFFDERPKDALADDDIARAVIWALEQPEGVDVNEILIRPSSQAN
ncbi:MAG: SDR family oxidoreductase, partial [Solirubrobacterales bacterium]